MNRNHPVPKILIGLMLKLLWTTKELLVYNGNISDKYILKAPTFTLLVTLYRQPHGKVRETLY